MTDLNELKTRGIVEAYIREHLSIDITTIGVVLFLTALTMTAIFLLRRIW